MFDRTLYMRYIAYIYRTRECWIDMFRVSISFILVDIYIYIYFRGAHTNELFRLNVEIKASRSQIEARDSNAFLGYIWWRFVMRACCVWRTSIGHSRRRGGSSSVAKIRVLASSCDIVMRDRFEIFVRSTRIYSAQECSFCVCLSRAHSKTFTR